MQVNYKILCDVRLLHEFYLTKPDGTTIFGAVSAAARDSFLQDFFNRNQRSINSDLDYQVPADAQRMFDNYHLKLVRGYSGFKIAIEVIPTTDSGKIAYQPLVSLPPDLNIPILLLRSSDDFDTYTNRRSSQPFDAGYYFSNGNSTGAIGATARTAPFLTSAIPAQSNTALYEQGELSVSGGAVSAFYVDNSNAKVFAPVTGKNFMNENDRNLVATSFNYYFTAADNTKNAVFTITDKNNTTVFTDTAKSDAPLSSCQLRVDERKVNPLPSATAEAAFVYTLAVTGDNGYNRSYKIVFQSAALAAAGVLGVVNLVCKPGLANFDLIDGKGLLIARYNADRTPVIAPPVFEIWIKSRYSFWRYINDEGMTLNDSHPAILKLTGDNLVTLVPKNHSLAPTAVAGLALPNPKPFSPVRPEGQRIFADILVPRSDIFPSGP
jgi:hypothetical protein